MPSTPATFRKKNCKIVCYLGNTHKVKNRLLGGGVTTVASDVNNYNTK